MNIEKRFKLFEDDYIQFEKIETKRSRRPDVHAFMLLDELVPGNEDIVRGTNHDEIFLSILPDDLNDNATDLQIQELIRCGVRYDSYSDSLSMFV